MLTVPIRSDTDIHGASGSSSTRPEKNNMNELFRPFAQAASKVMGSSWSFLVAGAVIVVWGITGPIYHYSDTWQLVINTVTSLVTFLMVFLIQNTQNRDSKAIQLKLNELIRGVEGARTGLVNLEALSDEELLQLQREFERLAEHKQSSKKALAAETARE
jgi:low affinity Fe/Cu permease